LTCQTVIFWISPGAKRLNRLAISRAWWSFTGLEGSLHSPYAHGLIEAAKARGWLGVVMHFRGCSGEPNRRNASITRVKPKTARGFYTGCGTIWHRANRAVGYSLGGNMLACLLAKEGESVPLDAAVIVSAPFMLEQCSYHMDKGFPASISATCSIC
jgi:predicted alpha/beta-fold hydrolase